MSNTKAILALDALLTDDNGLISPKAFPIHTRLNKKQTLKALSMAAVNYKQLLQDNSVSTGKVSPFPPFTMKPF